MRKQVQMCLALAFLVVASSLALGQQAAAPAAPTPEKKPLTNADVVKLVQAGLGDDTILLAIQNSATSFDTSPEALIELKAKGVSPAVMNAILKAGVAAHSPAAPAGAAPASSNPEGVALMARVVEAFGGAQRLATLQGTRYKGTRQVKLPTGAETTLQVEQLIVYPDRMVLTSSAGKFEFRTVVSTDVAFSTLPNGAKQNLPPSAKEDVLRSIKLSPLYVAQHAQDPSYTFVAGGTEKVGDADTAVLEVSAGGAQVRWNVDGSGRLLRTTRSAAGPGGTVQDVLDFADWRTVDGLVLPFRVTESGPATLVTTWSEFSANPTLDASLFNATGAQPANPQLKTRAEGPAPRQQIGGECPIEITKVDPRSYPFGTTGPCCQLQIKFRNSGDKTIVATKFGADFLDATNDRHDSAWNYTSDDVVRPGEKKGPHWDDIVYFEEYGYGIKAEAWLVKALFSDGTSWEDDGSKACKYVSWEKEKK